jgi:hypothetical protein
MSQSPQSPQKYLTKKQISKLRIMDYIIAVFQILFFRKIKKGLSGL